MSTSQDRRMKKKKEYPENWNRLPHMNKIKYDFLTKYDSVEDRDLMVEMLFTLKNINRLLDRNRQNTSKMVWWLIAVPILLFIFFIFISLLGFGSMRF